MVHIQPIRHKKCGFYRSESIEMKRERLAAEHRLAKLLGLEATPAMKKNTLRIEMDNLFDNL